jgi:pimeloyl-ACP methyl ester carboxylesterase
VRQFLLKNLKRDSNGAFFWQLNLAALHSAYEELLAGLRADRVCKRPALFLRGEKSDYIRAEDESLIRRLFPRAEIRTIAKAGHWLHADVPETFLRNVQEFFSG